MPSTARRNGRTAAAFGVSSATSMSLATLGVATTPSAAASSLMVRARVTSESAHAAGVVAGEPEVEVGGSQVEVRMMVCRSSRHADAVDHVQTGGEVTRDETGMQASLCR